MAIYAGSKRPADSEGETVHAGWKLAWIETLKSDRDVNGLTLKVGICISQRADFKGIARTASQEWIAKHLGSNPRVIRRCIQRLCKLGYIQRWRDAGGRGRATEYRLVKRTEAGGARIAAKNVPENPDSGVLLSTVEKPGLPGAENPDFPVPKPGPGSPTLPSLFQKYFQEHARPRVVGLGDHRKPVGLWQAIKEKIVQSGAIGEDKVEAWLDKLQIHSIADGVLKLLAPTKFIANYVSKNFEDKILEGWRDIEPSARQVRIEHVPRSPLAPAQDQRGGNNAAGA